MQNNKYATIKGIRFLALIILITTSFSLSNELYGNGNTGNISKSSRLFLSETAAEDEGRQPEDASAVDRPENQSDRDTTQASTASPSEISVRKAPVYENGTIDEPISKAAKKIMYPDFKTQNSDLLPVISQNSKMDQKKLKRRLLLRRAALIIGISLLLMAVISGASASIISGMFVSGNSAQTALNVGANTAKFNGSLFGWVTTFLLDLITSAGIYAYFKKEKPKLSLLSGGLRVIYSIFLGGAVARLIGIDTAGSASHIYNSMNSFYNIWNPGLIIFGVHLITLGILFKPEGGKKWVKYGIKAMLILAGIGYMIQNIGILFVANPTAFAAIIQPIFIVPMILGEVSFAVWMLIKGGKKAARVSE